MTDPYDRDSDLSDEPAPRRRFRCGGYANPNGHCGATDCATCYPSAHDEDDEDNEDDEPCPDA